MDGRRITCISDNNRYFASYYEVGVNENDEYDHRIQIGKFTLPDQVDSSPKINLYMLESSDGIPYIQWHVYEDVTYIRLLEYEDVTEFPKKTLPPTELKHPKITGFITVREAESGKLISNVCSNVVDVSEVFFDHLQQPYHWLYCTCFVHYMCIWKHDNIFNDNSAVIFCQDFKYNNETKMLDYCDVDEELVKSVNIPDYMENSEQIVNLLVKERFMKRWKNPNSMFYGFIKNTQKDYDNVKDEILSISDADVMLFIGNYQYSTVNCSAHVSGISETNFTLEDKREFWNVFERYTELNGYTHPLEHISLRFLINKTYELCVRIDFPEDRKYNEEAISTYIRKVNSGEVQKKIRDDPTVDGFYDTVYPGEDIPEEQKTFPEFVTYWRPLQI